jgi:hypothetical protein
MPISEKYQQAGSPDFWTTATVPSLPFYGKLALSVSARVRYNLSLWSQSKKLLHLVLPTPVLISA